MKNVMLIWATAAIAPSAAWGQIVTENAGTVSPETPIWQTRFEYTRSAHITDIRATETFLWAPNGSMDFALSVPIVHRAVDFTGIDGTEEGLGDMSLRWKYSLWKEDDVMKSTRFSPLLGVKLPTGRFEDAADGVTIPRNLQLGTGDFDLFGGPLFTYINDRHRFAAEVIGRYSFERAGLQVQPSLRVGLAYWYRIAPVVLEVAGEKTEVRGVLELTSTFYGQSRLDGQGIGDQGNITWLSPGVQVYPSPRILFEANVQIPVFESVDDAQGDRKFGVLLSIKFLF